MSLCATTNHIDGFEITLFSSHFTTYILYFQLATYLKKTAHTIILAVSMVCELFKYKGLISNHWFDALIYIFLDYTLHTCKRYGEWLLFVFQNVLAVFYIVEYDKNSRNVTLYFHSVKITSQGNSNTLFTFLML